MNISVAYASCFLCGYHDKFSSACHHGYSKPSWLAANNCHLLHTMHTIQRQRHIHLGTCIPLDLMQNNNHHVCTTNRSQRCSLYTTLIHLPRPPHQAFRFLSASRRYIFYWKFNRNGDLTIATPKNTKQVSTHRTDKRYE